MSHEIRTPMTAILGFTDLILEDFDDDSEIEKRRSAVQTIQRNGEHLLGLINDILDLSKIESGKLEIESIACSPSTVVQEVMGMMQVRALSKGISLESVMESPVPSVIQTDPTRLRQILLNLVSNAIKFTELGSVKVATRFIQGETPMLEFDLIDTGLGMTVDQQERLFRPFTQADTSMSRKFGGTGLGLTICKRLAMMLGGDVTIVSSTPNVGSHFRASIQANMLPESTMIAAHAPDANEKVAHATPVSESLTKPASETSPTPLSGCRILLAEDGPDNQRLISFVLKKAGAQVTVVENGLFAVDEATQA